MTKLRWVLLIFVLAFCAFIGGAWIYSQKCRGIDACAAQSAEGHERDKPSEAQ